MVDGVARHTGDYFTINAERRPEAMAWVFRDRMWTWREADARINRLAHALPSLGLKPGDRVALFSRNRPELAECYFALSKAGMAAVPVHPGSVNQEVAYVIRMVGVSVLFVAPELLHRVDPEIRESVRVVPLDDAYESLLDGMPDDEPGIPVDDDAIRAIKFTSGTTGLPKGCVSTNIQFQRNIRNYGTYIPLAPDEKGLLLAPMTAGVGMFWLSCYAAAGIPTVMVESFNAGQTLDLVERHGITRLGAVPTILAALIREQSVRPRDLSSLRLIDYTGAPASVPLIRGARQVLRVDLCQFFGASETGGMISVLTPAEHEVVLQHMDDGIVPSGRLIHDVEVRLVDRNGEDLPLDQVGEMVVRAPTNMSGYWNQPQKTAEVLRDGWLYSGDLARFDGRGFLTIMGRTRDEIITGGMNVYAPEVEAIILKHPDVTETAVVGVPDPYWGEAIRAYVVSRNGALTVDDIKRHCEISLANYKRPSSIVFVDGLPKTSSGKIRRGELYADDTKVEAAE